MSYKETSKLQQQIYQFIVAFIKSEQKPPTIREIGFALGIASTGHVDFLLMALEKQGLIIREAKKSRGIKLTQWHVGIPLKGTIAAGVPLDIFPEVTELFLAGMTFQDENIFALLVRGQSMVDEHICDGDYVIIMPQSTCQNGDIVVATNLLAGVNGSATLKRFFQERDQVRLQPANAEMAPMMIPKQVWDREW